MIVFSDRSNAGTTIKRFRLDALVIFLIGLGGVSALLYLLVNDSITASLFLIPFLFSLACFALGFNVLRAHPFEHVHVNLQEKRLIIFKKGQPLHQLPLSGISMLYTTGGMYKTMLIKYKNDHIELFQSFFFTRQFYRFAAALAKEHVPLSAQLKQQLALKGKNIWRVFIVLLFVITAFIIAFFLLKKGA